MLLLLPLLLLLLLLRVIFIVGLQSGKIPLTPREPLWGRTLPRLVVARPGRGARPLAAA
jgi:hypothetical protein